MTKLYYYPLCPFSRIIRIALSEKNIESEDIIECPWDRQMPIRDIHFLSDLPLFVEDERIFVEGWYAVFEYIERHYYKISLLGAGQSERLEARRIAGIFNEWFFAEVTQKITFEKIFKRYIEKIPPDSTAIRQGITALDKYMEYISWLTDRRNWLAGSSLTIADISAAAQISTIDYTGALVWDKYPQAKEWYVRIKSRPSFRSILKDRVATVSPPAYYSELDF